DERGWLFIFLARRDVGVSDTSRFSPRRIELDLRDPRTRAQLEIAIRHRDRDDGDVWAALGVCLAPEPLAVPAVHAGAKPGAVRIGVRARRIRCRTLKRMVAGLSCRLLEEHVTVASLERRQRILTVAWSLEDVAALLKLPTKVARLPADTGRPLE